MQPLPRYRIYSSPSDYVQIARDVLTGSVGSGPACSDLESAVVSRHDAGHALSIAKARVGIYVTVRALIEPGQKVIVSPYTISDVINMVICAGGVPVFADLEPGTCNVDAAEIEKLIDDDTGAVMVTHLHGLSCDMAKISRLCRERGVPLIEDAAQAFGARFEGKALGTFGDAGIYSFGMYKNLNAFFGGMVVTPRADLQATLRSEIDAFPSQEVGYYLTKAISGLATDVATWPLLFKALTYRVFRFGFLNEVGLLNNQVSVDQFPEMKRDLPETYLRRLTPMQARIVLPQLDGVDEAIRARIEFAKIYDAGLQGIDGLGLPPLREDFSHTYSYYPVQVEDREGFLKHMMRERCDVAAQHMKNCASLECFEEWRRDCPVAERTSHSVVLLPTYPRYSREDADRNVRVIREYFGAA